MLPGLDDIDPVLEILRTAARAEILPRFRRLEPGQVTTKSAHDDLVTAADTGAERRIAGALSALWPHALVFGEEAVAADPTLVHQLPEAELAFVIDPVDGTWNFAAGLATFGSIVVALKAGEPVMGVLYDPLLDDAIFAVRGAGAWFGRGQGDAVRLAIGPDPSPGLTGFLPLALLPADKRPQMAASFPNYHRVLNLRCSAHELRLMAQGRVDFVVSAGLSPWDHAAGVLIVREAGGVAERLDGRPYRADQRDGCLVFARTPPLWEEIARRNRFLLD